MATVVSPGNPLPPSYADTLDHIASMDDKSSPSDLPPYGQIHHLEPALSPAAQGETREFDYSVTKGGHPFLVMTLITTGPHTQDTPIFVEGSPVTGKIQLHLKKLDSISSVVLTVKGSIVMGGTLYAGGGNYAGLDSFTTVFLDQKHTVWSEENQQHKAALHGDYAWPFSIDLPDEVVMPEGAHHQPKKFRLPQTFHQRFVHATVKYEITVTVVRKGILHSNDALSTPFAYIPVVRPPPLPPLRRLAYEEGTPLLGPKVDPDGWYLQKAVQIEGALFNGRSARVECRLFLANPLSYTRGSIVPLFMTLESDDSQLLDLLSSPDAISVRVQRHVKYDTGSHDKLVENKPLYSLDFSQRAVWWRATEYAGEGPQDRLRTLNGELHLRPDMVPTSAMKDYSVNYSVVLFPFDTPGFKVDKRPNPSLLEQPITLVTAFAPGPRPRMSTPADYTPDIKKDAADNLQKADVLAVSINDYYMGV